MKKILVAAFALLSVFTNAQKLDKGLLWKVSGNGLSKPSYLFGTMHATCDATLDKNIMDAMEATTQLYLEIDMDDPNLTNVMMGGMTMKDGKTMSSLTTPEDFKIVNEFLQKNLGMPATMLNTVKPFMINSMLLPMMLDCPMQSLEQELSKVAKQQNEEVHGLETIQDQLAVFDAIPYEEQMAELVKTAKDNMVSDKAEFKKMLELYNSKDINALEAYMKEPQNALYAEHDDILLANRNKNWIPVIEATAKKTPTFFAVGAAHLAGEEGVIALLRKKGYKVEVVK